MSAALLLPLFLALGAQASPGDALARARALVAEGALDQALQVLEAELVDHADDVALQRAHAETLERFVDAGGSWLALNDARDAWDRACRLAPADEDLCRGRIAVRLRLGEHAEARDLAERALGSAWLSGGRVPADLLELACRARLGALPPREAPPPEREAALREAWSALEHARGLAADAPGLVRLAAGLLESEGLADRASAELVAALERIPTATELHRALIDLYVREGIEERLGALYERWSAGGTNATLAWFTGYVARLGGDVALRERRHADALELYERAGQWMGVAATLEPSFRETAEDVRFQAQVSAGWCELELGESEYARLGAASERLLGLLRAHPARRDAPDGLGRTLMHALSALGERRIAYDDFEGAAADVRTIVTQLPDEGAWWNNLGFLLREHATQLESGKIADVPDREVRSRDAFRASWQAYRRATELLPDDPRVLNDAALVQIYHVRDELAAAEVLLERAIDLGERQFAALGPGAEERARFPLALTLGDAYLNRGYLYYHLYRQPARARESFERSLATDTGPRPDLAEYLAAIEGTRGPVPEPDRGAFVGPPRRAPRPRAALPWEASLAEARERARVEGRTLVLYHRGEGLALPVTDTDAVVTSPEFARATDGAVLLLSDAGRITFVDRRRDGRRVGCPHFGTVTCAEHVQAYADVCAWLSEVRGAPPGASEEGLWVLRPGADAPEHVAGIAELAIPELVVPSAELASEPFEALEASLGGEDGGGEARALVATRSLQARIAVERILWDGFRSSPAREFLLAALVEERTPANAELLATSVRQCADPELELAALSVWPATLDPEPVVHAWLWSPASAVRAAAEQVLLRERPDDPRWSARTVLVH